MPLILASASPRRRELLTQAGYEFQIHPAHIPEDPHPNEDPIAYVTRLARQKAEAVYNEIAVTETNAAGAPGLASETWEGSTPNETSLIVLGADTTVTLDNQILGKPENAEDAARMLRLLSGRTHRVITGVCLVSGSCSANHGEGADTRAVSTAAEVTAVQFLSLSEAEIQAYIATGEPNDKAGAYAIQGHAARWIPRIEGCYFNVVGLPISLVSTLLDQVL
jgi:septum formation protein